MKFEVGSYYRTRSICDSACIISIRVLHRTAKTITVDCGEHHGIKTFRPSVQDGVEFIRPWGNYSMAPILRADNKE